MARAERMLVVQAPGAACWIELLGLPTLQKPPPRRTDTVPWKDAAPSRLDWVRLEFEDGAFDTVACPLGISMLPKARYALAEWKRLLRPHGKVLTSALGATAFRPLLDLYSAQLFDYGLASASGSAVVPWRRFDGPEAVSRLVRDAGFARVTVVVQQVGRYLRDSAAWWDVLAAAGLLSPLDKLSAPELDGFKQEHLREVAILAKTDGIWLEIPVASVVACKLA